MGVVAFIIGIPTKYRGQLLERQLDSAGVNHTRVPGVVGTYNGHPVDAHVDHEAVATIRGVELTKAEIGCALAHVDAISLANASDDDWALILEDDARVVDDAGLREILDLVEGQFRTSQPLIIMLFGRRVLASRRVAARLRHGTMRELAITPYTTTAYLTNRAARDQLSRFNLPVHGTADWPPRIARHVRFLCAFPWVMEPAKATGSTIGDRDHDTQSSSARSRRAFAAWTHFAWLNERGAYGSYRAYVETELRQPLIRTLMRGRIEHFTPEASDTPPLTNSAAELAHRLTRRRHWRTDV